MLETSNVCHSKTFAPLLTKSKEEQIICDVHRVCKQAQEYLKNNHLKQTYVKFFRIPAINLIKRANYTSLSEYLKARETQGFEYQYLLQSDFKQQLIGIHLEFPWEEFLLAFTNKQITAPFKNELKIELIELIGTPNSLYFSLK